MNPVIIFYLLTMVIINLFTLFMFIVDKQAASAGRWRISERNLLLMLLLGGVIGGVIGIFGIRHKSQHRSFRLVVTIALVFHTVLAIWILAYGGRFGGA
jgi:uncharacterized membrane protein YsdA (DUF1294 family)